MNVASTRPCSLCAPASGHSEYMEEHIDGEQCRSVSASKLCVVVSVQVVAEPSSGGWQHSHSQRFGGSALPIQCLFSSHILTTALRVSRFWRLLLFSCKRRTWRCSYASTTPCSLCAPASGHSELRLLHITAVQCRSDGACHGKYS